ncbi:hypothetical protein [Pyxidicoccus caerfyrddinensis]|uniref:hypothetical protein n=1 Tax=Pyxidicoccus caerfyrddinensis TaxID=2709663 RepID=UPI0013DB94BA|nr:hypothetical protein [Pyxidicoccus caerfyrddinensis]
MRPQERLLHPLVDFSVLAVSRTASQVREAADAKPRRAGDLQAVLAFDASRASLHVTGDPLHEAAS